MSNIAQRMRESPHSAVDIFASGEPNPGTAIAQFVLDLKGDRDEDA